MTKPDFISELELSVRASNVLRRMGIADRESFMALTKDDVLSSRNAGRRTWNEIRELQAYFNRPRPPKPWGHRDQIALAMLPAVYTCTESTAQDCTTYEESCAMRAFALADAFLEYRERPHG